MNAGNAHSKYDFIKTFMTEENIRMFVCSFVWGFYEGTPLALHVPCAD